MEIIKIYNNNIIAVLLETNQIGLVTGKGIGFKAKQNKKLELTEEYQLFTFAEPNKSDIQRIIDQIDADALEIAREIVDKARETNDYPIVDSLLLQLADHISFKVELQKQDINIPNLLMSEIKVFYPKEFKIGEYGVTLINKNYQLNFGEDEASYLALHILNSSIHGRGTDVYKITDFIKEMVGFINEIYDKNIGYNDWTYERLIVHLKFLAQRLLLTEKTEKQIVLGDTFFEQSENELIKAQKIIQAANSLSKRIFGRTLGKNEEIYLSLHVMRMH